MRMYPKSHRFLEPQLGLALTPVLEEEVGMSSPLPSFSGDFPLPPLPGEPVQPPVADNSPLPPLPGESPALPVATVSPLPSLPKEKFQPPKKAASPPVEVAALASVRSSVKELQDLEELVGKMSPAPPHTHSPASPLSPHHSSPRTQGTYIHSKLYNFCIRTCTCISTELS